MSIRDAAAQAAHATWWSVYERYLAADLRASQQDTPAANAEARRLYVEQDARYDAWLRSMGIRPRHTIAAQDQP